ncbi:uncharacterized protein BJ171DRAFT_422110 [Polychytrium aggregatum]|uniref:uncharacterized protein n=1 Tax=Polychytrium aggregatum TaxID=110093 RepID=UPI0022FEA1ED|nr:uncharacterized protein BJ171DRAFT_422110 [Polychytrium aggregatum]KAI9206383.1 hypothetical protein BJ171DRAFT_422110 [Polychytrium aggregatum]
MDIYYIAFGVSPLALLCIVTALADNSISEALYRPRAPKSKSGSGILASLWQPQWQVLKNSLPRPSYFGNPWSLGEVLVVLLLVACNLAWIFVPIIIELMDPESGSSTPLTPLAIAYNWTKDISLWAAWAGLWDAGLCILFAIRENFVSKKLLGTEAGQYHRTIRFHIGLGYTSFLLMTLHSLFFLISAIVQGKFVKTMLPWSSNYGYWNFAGLVSWVALVGMVATSVYKVRRSNYRVFYWTHQLYVVFFFFAFIHKGLVTTYPIMFPILYFIYDRLRPRLFFKRRTMALVQRTSSSTIIKLDIPIEDSWRGASTYAPGDWVNICIPELSRVAWHAFSVASYCHDTPDRLTLYIKAGGKWTNALGKMVQENEHITLPIKVDGPFGPRCTSYLLHERVFMLTGGSGLAALLPFLYHYMTAGPASGKVRLIWTVKNEADVLAFSGFLVDMVDDASPLGNRVRLDLHITGDMSPEYATIARSTTKYENDLATLVRGTRATLNRNTLKIPRKNLAKKTRMADLALVLIIFIFGIAGWYLGVFVNPTGPELALCSSNNAYKLVGLDHFICWYSLPAASPVLSALFAAVGGYIAATALGYSRKMSNRVSRFLLNHAMVQKPSGASATLASLQARRDLLYAILAKMNVIRVRPDIGRSLHEMNGYARDRKLHVAVMAAGPERFMRTVQHKVVDCDHLDWYRESWKV